MKRLACRYAIIRFLPYPETQEFANVGIVLSCPETGYFSFKLEKRRYSRITAFFSKLDASIYRSAVSLFDTELERVAGQMGERRFDREDFGKLFDALVHPREAIIRFGSPRALLTDSAEQALEQLFAYYVEHDFATPEYQERVVMKRVRALVNGLQLERPFKPRDIGNHDYAHAHFPLVQWNEERVLKAIKPFFLGQDEPNKILTHGGAWVDRVKRLRKHRLLPEAVLFAVEGPAPGEGLRYDAFEEICGELIEYDVQVVPAAKEQQIRTFATA